MNYYARCGTPFPAFVVFLLDQSASMMNISLDGGNRSEIASRNIQWAILEIVRMCAPNEEIKDRAFISVIGYGQLDNSAHVIRQGWVSDWAEDILIARKNNTCIIPEVAEGFANVNVGFHLAYDMIEEWISLRKEDFMRNNLCGLGPILIINITDGVVDDKTKTNEIATKIKVLQNTWLFNILIPKYVVTDIILPNNKYCLNGTGIDSECRFYYDISSTLTINKENCWRFECRGCEGVSIGSNIRGLIVSSNDKSASIITGIMCHND